MDQSRINLKNVVRSMSASEVCSLSSVFSKQIGLEIERFVKAISPKCIMVTIAMDKERISGYGRTEEEASLNAYKNFLEGMIDKDQMVQPLTVSLNKMRECHSRSKKPPKGRTEGQGNTSLFQQSIDKSNSLYDRIKTLNQPSELNKSRHNDSADQTDEDNKLLSRGKNKSFLGKSFMETEVDKSRVEGNTSGMQAGKSRTPDRALYVHEPHDCLYR